MNFKQIRDRRHNLRKAKTKMTLTHILQESHLCCICKERKNIVYRFQNSNFQIGKMCRKCAAAHLGEDVLRAKEAAFRLKDLYDRDLHR